MNDYKASKIICRILTLITYILTGSIVAIEPFLLDEGVLDVVLENLTMMLVIFTTILIIIMITSIIIKYKFKEKSKVTPYRILDVLTRIFFTMPTTLLVNMYIIQGFRIDDYKSFCFGFLIFFVLNEILKLTLQDTMDVTFIKTESL